MNIKFSTTQNATVVLAYARLYQSALRALKFPTVTHFSADAKMNRARWLCQAISNALARSFWPIFYTLKCSRQNGGAQAKFATVTHFCVFGLNQKCADFGRAIVVRDLAVHFLFDVRFLSANAIVLRDFGVHFWSASWFGLCQAISKSTSGPGMSDSYTFFSQRAHEPCGLLVSGYTKRILAFVLTYALHIQLQPVISTSHNLL